MNYDIAGHQNPTDLIRLIEAQVKQARPEELNLALHIIRSTSPQTSNSTLSERSISPLNLLNESRTSSSDVSDVVDHDDIKFEESTLEASSQKSHVLAETCLSLMSVGEDDEFLYQSGIAAEGFSSTSDYIKHKLIQEITIRVEQRAVLKSPLAILSEVKEKIIGKSSRKKDDCIGHKKTAGTVLFYLKKRKDRLTENIHQAITQSGEDSPDVKVLKLQKVGIKKLIAVFENKPKLLLFPQNETERETVYQGFAQRLVQLFEELTPAELDAAFCVGDGSLCDLHEVCQTGWGERIEALIPQHINEKTGLLGFSQSVARSKRRAIAERDLIRSLCVAALGESEPRHEDVHSIAIGKILLNEPFALEYSSQELSQNESPSYRLFFQQALNLHKLQGLFNKKYTPQTLQEEYKNEFSHLNSEAKSALIQEMRTIYFKAAKADSSLYFDPQGNLRALFERALIANELPSAELRDQRLSHLRNDCIAQNSVQPFSMHPEAVLRIITSLKQKHPNKARKLPPLSLGAQGVAGLVSACKAHKLWEDLSAKDKKVLNALSEPTLFLSEHRKEVHNALNRIENHVLELNCINFERALVDLDPKNQTQHLLSDFGATIILAATGMTEQVLSEDTSSEGAEAGRLLSVLQNVLAEQEVTSKTTDKALLLANISQDRVLHLADKSLLNDPNFMIEAIGQNAKCLQYAPDSLFENSFFCEKFLYHPGIKHQYPQIVANLPTSQKSNETLINILVRLCPGNKLCDFLSNLNPKFRNNPKFVNRILNRITEYELPKLIKATGKDLKNNAIFVQPVLNRCPKDGICSFVANMGDDLRNNQEFIQPLLDQIPHKSVPYFLIAIGGELKNNANFVAFLRDICPQDEICSFVANMGNDLRNDQEFIQPLLDQINQDRLPMFLAAIGKQLKNKQSFITPLINSSDKSHIRILVIYMGSELKDDSDVMTAALSKYSENKIVDFMEQLGPELKSSSQFMRKVVKKCSSERLGELIPLLDDSLKQDEQFISDLIQKAKNLDPITALESLPFSAKNNAIVMSSLLQHCNDSNIEHFTAGLGDDLKNDRAFTTALLQGINPNTLHLVVPHLGEQIRGNTQFMTNILKHYNEHLIPKFIEALSDELKRDQNLVRDALARCKRTELDDFNTAMGDHSYERFENDLQARRRMNKMLFGLYTALN